MDNNTTVAHAISMLSLKKIRKNSVCVCVCYSLSMRNGENESERKPAQQFSFGKRKIPHVIACICIWSFGFQKKTVSKYWYYEIS